MTRSSDAESALVVRALTVRFGADTVVDGLDLDAAPGELVAVVGASGSGKTQAVLAMMGLSPAQARVQGSVRVGGEEVVGAPDDSLARLRGARIATVFQDASTALNPYLTVGVQIREVLAHHLGIRGARADARACELLDAVRIPDARRRLREYPHQLSGGMRQRVMLATAIACRPAVLLADEPTTALDVTVQAQILALLDDLRRDMDLAVVLVTHDLGVVAGCADRVVVMDAGRVVEAAPVDELFAQPRAEATRALLDAARSGAG